MTQPFSSDNIQLAQQAVPAATVVIGTVTLEDSSAKFDSNIVADIFTDTTIVNRYEKDRHIYMGGVTDPNGFQGNSVSFVQLCSPTLLWICDWTIASFRSQPSVPSPTPGDANWVLMDDHWEPHKITTAADGTTPLYRISGTYVYGHKNPNADTVNNIAFPRPPWLQDAFDRSMPSSKLTTGLTEAGGIGGSSIKTSPAPAQGDGSAISPAQQVGGIKG